MELPSSTQRSSRCLCHLFGNAFSDVHLGSEAAHAEVGGVGVDGGAALAAENLSKLPGQLRG